MENKNTSYKVKIITLAILGLIVRFEFYWIGYQLLEIYVDQRYAIPGHDQRLRQQEESTSIPLAANPVTQGIYKAFVKKFEAVYMYAKDLPSNTIKAFVRERGEQEGTGAVRQVTQEEANQLARILGTKDGQQAMDSLGLTRGNPNREWKVQSDKNVSEDVLSEVAENASKQTRSTQLGSGKGLPLKTLSDNEAQKLQEQALYLPDTLKGSELERFKDTVRNALPEIQKYIGEDQALDGSLARAAMADAEKIVVKDATTDEVIREIPITEDIRQALNKGNYFAGNINRTDLNTLGPGIQQERLLSEGKAFEKPFNEVFSPETNSIFDPSSTFRSDRGDIVRFNDTSPMSSTWKPSEVYTLSLPGGQTVDTVGLLDSFANRVLYVARTDVDELLKNNAGNKILKLNTMFRGDMEKLKALGYTDDQISQYVKGRLDDYIKANGSPELSRTMDSVMGNKDFATPLKDYLGQYRKNPELFPEGGSPGSEATQKISDAEKARVQARINDYLELSDGEAASKIGTPAKEAAPSEGTVFKSAIESLEQKGTRLNPITREVFEDPNLLKALPASIRDNPDEMAKIMDNTSKLQDLVSRNPEGLFGKEVTAPEVKLADGSIRPAQTGREIDLDYLRSQGIDPEKVLVFRNTEPSATPKPEYFWTSDYFETVKGLRQEIPDAQRSGREIMVSDLATVHKNGGGLIRDVNDDRGLAVRQIGEEFFDQKKALGKIKQADVEEEPISMERGLKFQGAVPGAAAVGAGLSSEDRPAEDVKKLQGQIAQEPSLATGKEINERNFQELYGKVEEYKKSLVDQIPPEHQEFFRQYMENNPAPSNAPPGYNESILKQGNINSPELLDAMSKYDNAVRLQESMTNQKLVDSIVPQTPEDWAVAAAAAATTPIAGLTGFLASPVAEYLADKVVNSTSNSNLQTHKDYNSPYLWDMREESNNLLALQGRLLDYGLGKIPLTGEELAKLNGDIKSSTEKINGIEQTMREAPYGFAGPNDAPNPKDPGQDLTKQPIETETMARSETEQVSPETPGWGVPAGDSDRSVGIPTLVAPPTEDKSLSSTGTPPGEFGEEGGLRPSGDNGSRPYTSESPAPSVMTTTPSQEAPPEHLRGPLTQEEINSAISVRTDTGYIPQAPSAPAQEEATAEMALQKEAPERPSSGLYAGGLGGYITSEDVQSTLENAGSWMKDTASAAYDYVYSGYKTASDFLESLPKVPEAPSTGTQSGDVILKPSSVTPPAGPVTDQPAPTSGDRGEGVKEDTDGAREVNPYAGDRIAPSDWSATSGPDNDFWSDYYKLTPEAYEASKSAEASAQQGGPTVDNPWQEMDPSPPPGQAPTPTGDLPWSDWGGETGAYSQQPASDIPPVQSSPPSSNGSSGETNPDSFIDASLEEIHAALEKFFNSEEAKDKEDLPEEKPKDSKNLEDGEKQDGQSEKGEESKGDKKE